jgi:hypothetical protein
MLLRVLVLAIGTTLIASTSYLVPSVSPVRPARTFDLQSATTADIQAAMDAGALTARALDIERKATGAALSSLRGAWRKVGAKVAQSLPTPSLNKRAGAARRPGVTAG